MVKLHLWGTDLDLKVNDATFPDEKEMDDILFHPKHGYFKGTTGDLLHYRKYLPEDDTPKAICIWQHGIHAHSGMACRLKSGRYTNMGLLARSMVKAGMGLYAPDLLGHGYSEGDRFYIPNGDWTINRNDLDAFARFAASEHDRDTPIFLMGESYGACLVIHVARHWQDAAASKAVPPPPAGFRGLVIAAPAIIGDLPPKPVVFVLRNILKPLFPKWTPFFMPHPINPHRIWRNDEVRETFTSEKERNEGLHGGGRRYCLGTAAGLLSATEAVREVSIPGLTVPFCVSHGTLDCVPIAGTDFLLEHANTHENDRAVDKKEGAFHDLLSEDTAEETVDFMIEWIKTRISARPCLSIKESVGT